MKRKLGWRGVMLVCIALGFLAGVGMLLIAIFLMLGRGEVGEDLWAAIFMAGMMGIIGTLMMYLAIKRRAYIGNNGEVLPYVIMAQMLGNDEFDIGDDDFSD